MYLLVSGEGPGDIGTCHPSSDICDRKHFNEGPMTLIIDSLVESFQGYEMSHLETERISYVSKAYLAQNKQPSKKKSMALKGKKRPAETQYYFENARALAVKAKSIKEDINDNVVAILFRDSDGTASAGRGNWADKRQSMIKGFKAEGFELGVPMVPKPKSEAWLLCATKTNPYQHCARLEDESGNDNAGRTPLKDQLSDSLGGNSSTSNLNQQFRDGNIDIHRIDMPSFNIFKSDLAKAVKLIRKAAR